MTAIYGNKMMQPGKAQATRPAQATPAASPPADRPKSPLNYIRKG